MSLALQVRAGDKEQWQGPFQSRGGREETGRQIPLKQSVCALPLVTSPESRGLGLRRARFPFSPFATKLIIQHKAVLVHPGFKPLSGCPLLLG